jgi:hypothetical protein
MSGVEQQASKRRQQRRQGLLEVSGRDASQIKHRQKRIQALRSPCPQRQDRRGEPDPLAVADGPAIPNLHPGDLDSADPRLDRTFGTMTVANNTISPISKPELLHRGKKHLGLQLDSLREQLSRARSQDIGQGIIDLVGVTKTNNIAILIHGVSLSLRGSGRLDTRLDTPPISLRHHPGSGLALCKTAPRRFWQNRESNKKEQVRRSGEDTDRLSKADIAGTIADHRRK